MKTLSNYQETKTASAEAYVYYFIIKTTGKIIRVFTGGAGSSARCAGLIRESYNLLPLDVKGFDETAKTGQKLIAKALKNPK
jgi:hypothetical protein